MALDGHVLVSTEALVSQAGTVKSELANMQQLFETLRNLVNSTVTFWTGDAGEYHRTLYQQQVGTIEEIIRHYEEHVRDLEQMAGVYSEAERVAENAAEALALSNLD